MHFRKFTSLSLLLLASLGTVVACSSDADEPTPSTSSSTTTRISAEEGGKVSDPSGKATLNIPPGALAEDTDITLSVSAATSETVAGIYDFGPDGLAFLKPATLEIAVDTAAVGDKQVAVALETDGKFVALAGSSYANGVAQAEIEHFSKFTVVFVDGKPVGTDCADTIEGFEACGGDLKGTWVLESFCVAYRDDIDEKCPERTGTLEIEVDGREISFADDGSYSESTATNTYTSISTAPLSCFGDADSCASLIDDLGTCEGDEVCTCERVTSDTKEGKNGSYAVEGNTVNITISVVDGDLDWDDVRKPEPYCVKGDSLSVVYPGSRGDAFATYKRK